MSENNLQLHRKLAAETFNQVWDLMDKTERTAEETLKMIHLAHASVYHWSFAGTAINAARGEWQVSRVYCVAGLAQSALYHANHSLEICKKEGFGDFDLAFGHEAVARAQAMLGNTAEAEKHLNLGRQAAKGIKETGDRDYFLSELESIQI